MNEAVFINRLARRFITDRLELVLLCAVLLSLGPTPASGTGLKPGTPLPSFTATDLDGETVVSTASKGKVRKMHIGFDRKLRSKPLLKSKMRGHSVQMMVSDPTISTKLPLPAFLSL